MRIPYPRMHRRAAVLAWLVASLGVIVAVIAIGMDGGRLMEGRRTARAAADAAALAAAADLYENFASNQGTDPLGTARQAALNSAAANGYANDGTTSTVTVNIPPTQGTFAGQADHVEVVLQVHLHGSFSAAINGGDLPLEVRAVARGRTKKIGVLVLNPNAAGAFSGLGFGTLDVVGSTITVNSTSLLAFLQIGGNIVASVVAVVGNLLLTGGALLGLIQTGGQPTADPLSTLPAPNVASYVVQSSSKLTINSGTVVLQPGVYQGGISIGGTANVTLAPGVFILGGGGFQVTGSATVTGNGVMLYNTTGTAAAAPVSFNSTGKVILSPPTTGTYTGLSIFEDRSVSQPVQITANGNMLLTGSVYAPGAQVQLNGGGWTDVVGGSLISDRFNFSGMGRITVNPGTGRPLVPEVMLVE